MKKRVASILLALVMMVSLLPVNALALARDTAKEQVRVIVENTTYTKAEGAPWDGKLVDTWVGIDKDSTMMSCVVDALTEKGYTQQGAENNYIEEINGLAAFDGGDLSGWMGTLNDWFTDEGFAAFTVADGKLKAGDEVCIMYTCDWGADIGCDWSNNDKSIASISVSGGNLTPAFNADTHNYQLRIDRASANVTVTPTATNKDYQVRTYLNDVEKNRTDILSVKNGDVITVKCGDPAWPTMNDNAGPAQVYKITVAAPAVAVDGITLDRNSMTMVKDEVATLTANVTPDNAADKTVIWSSSNESVATVDNGKVTAVAVGQTTVTATTKDGNKSASCQVTVANPVALTVKAAPKTVSVKFYNADGTAELPASQVTDNGVVGNFHQYTLNVPNGTYSYRGMDGTTNLGGEIFTVDKAATMNLLRENVRFNGAALNQAGDYTFTLKNGSNEVIYGEPYLSSNIRYTPTLLIAGKAHTGTVTLAEKWEDDYYTTTFNNVTPPATATAATTVNLPITAYKKITLTAPSDATVTFYKQNKNFNVSPITLNTGAMDRITDNGDGTTTYVFKATAAHSNYSYRAMMTGKVTQAGYLKDGDNIVVTFPDNRTPADTASTMAYDDNSVLLNINEKNKLSMAVGETFKLRAYRAAWQIINTTTGNIMIEPDFHYVILSGSDVIDMAATAESSVSGNCCGNTSGNWMNITAKKAGTAVVAVYYDAVDVYGANPTNATGISTFGATAADRYGVFVVNVGGNADVTWNAASHDGDWDAEFDTVYYNGDNGIFTFKPDKTPSKVTVQNVLGSTLGEAKTVTAADDGSYAVPVTTGANIIAVTTESGTDYQIVRARKISYTITNNTTGESATNAAPAIKTGDNVTVSFDKLNMPIPKFSGIYNPGYMSTAKTAYTLNDSTVLTSAGTQYDFSTKNSITFTAHVAGTNSLTGYISLSSMGSDFGAHRGVDDNGAPANMNAAEKFGDFGVLPDITFEVEDSGTAASYDDATKVTALTVKGANSTGYIVGFTNWSKVADGNSNWTADAAAVATYALTANVKTADYNNTLELRYWYDGEEVHSAKLTSGVTKTISDFALDANKILNLQVVVTPWDTSLGNAKVYTYTVYPGKANQKYVHPIISALTAKDGTVPLTMTPAMNTSDTDYSLELGDAAAITLNGTQLVKIYNASTAADMSDEVKLRKMKDGAPVGEAMTVVAKGAPTNPNRNWTLEKLDISDADELVITVTSYVDENISRTYHIALTRDESTDAIAAKAVANTIKAIGEVTMDSEEAIAAAREAYDALSDAQKELVTNYDVLTVAEETLAALQKSAAEVAAVEDAIKAIGEVTMDSEESIAAAREAYDGLSDVQQAQVSNYDVLTAAEETLAALQKSAAEVAAVEDAIDAIGEVTMDSEEAIEAAREAYNALSEEQQEQVSNYDALVEAEETLADLKDDDDDDDFALWEKVYTETCDYLAELSEKTDATVSSIGGEWWIIAMARGDVEPSEGFYDRYYQTVLDTVANSINDKEQLHRAKSTENARVILGMVAAGFDPTDVDGHNLLQGLTDMPYLKKQGINGPIWALIAFDSHDFEIPEALEGQTQVTRESLIATILDAQLPDGGWTLSGTQADVDVTSMALQALAPYYDTDDAVKNAVDQALDMLSDMQGQDGGFGSWGTVNSESCAQVIVALTALGIDPDSDSRFVKDGNSVLDALCTFAVNGGGFAHTKDGALNGMATEQGAYALAAYVRFLYEENRLYDMTDVDFDDTPEKYIILDGDNSVVTEDESVTIHISGALEDFVELLIDGEVVDPANYTLTEGSTIVTLAADYLATLEKGTHLLTFVYVDGEVSTYLTVKGEGEGNPDIPKKPDPIKPVVDPDPSKPIVKPIEDGKVITTDVAETGDESMITLWMVLAGAAAMGVVCVSKKRREA